MRHYATRPPRRATRAAFAFVLTAAFGAAYALPLAQVPAKKVLTVEDYPKWRTIGGQEISADGNWATYGLSFTNTVPAESKPVLHLVRLDSITTSRTRRRRVADRRRVLPRQGLEEVAQARLSMW